MVAVKLVERGGEEGEPRRSRSADDDEGGGRGFSASKDIQPVCALLCMYAVHDLTAPSATLAERITLTSLHRLWEEGVLPLEQMQSASFRYHTKSTLQAGGRRRRSGGARGRAVKRRKGGGGGPG